MSRCQLDRYSIYASYNRAFSFGEVSHRHYLNFLYVAGVLKGCYIVQLYRLFLSGLASVCSACIQHLFNAPTPMINNNKTKGLTTSGVSITMGYISMYRHGDNYNSLLRDTLLQRQMVHAVMVLKRDLKIHCG